VIWQERALLCTVTGEPFQPVRLTARRSGGGADGDIRCLVNGIAPRVAILYAYGIQIEAFFNTGTVSYYGAQPNGSSNGKAPSVALLAEDAKAYEVGGPAFERLQVWYSDPARLGKHASIDDVRRRVERDEERLLRKVARVDRIVPLDDLDPKNAVVSLDRAAAKLVGEGIAEA
jgi:hypothetical protein